MNGTLDNHTPRVETQRKAIKNTEHDDIEEEDDDDDDDDEDEDEDEEEEIVEVKKGKLVNVETSLLHTAHRDVYGVGSCVIRAQRYNWTLISVSLRQRLLCCIHCSQNLLLSCSVQ